MGAITRNEDGTFNAVIYEYGVNKVKGRNLVMTEDALQAFAVQVPKLVAWCYLSPNPMGTNDRDFFFNKLEEASALVLNLYKAHDAQGCIKEVSVQFRVMETPLQEALLVLLSQALNVTGLSARYVVSPIAQAGSEDSQISAIIGLYFVVKKKGE